MEKKKVKVKIKIEVCGQYVLSDVFNKQHL